MLRAGAIPLRRPPDPFELVPLAAPLSRASIKAFLGLLIAADEVANIVTRYLGTVAGVILITLLQSILSVMQMEEAFRQVIYGAVIIVMLLVYGRGAKVQG